MRCPVQGVACSTAYNKRGCRCHVCTEWRRVKYQTRTYGDVATTDEDGPETTVTGVSEHRITSLEELYSFFEIPYVMVEGEGGEMVPYSDDYELRHFRINSWEQHSTADGTKTLYQVRAVLRPRLQDEGYEAAHQQVRAMLEEMEEHVPDWFPDAEPPSFDGDPCLLEVAIMDPHFGMLAWGEEVGANYDSQIAARDYEAAVDYLLRFAHLYPIERILYLVGNDMLHVDAPSSDAQGNRRGGATTRGTAQDIDSRLDKMFTTVRKALIRGIDKAASVAPVDVLVVPGNHDRMQMYRMGEVLSAWYRNTPRVTVRYGPNKRKFYGYGRNVFMYTHGEEYKRQRDSLPLIFATECPAELDWQGAVCREIHTGHNHVLMEGRYHPTSEASETRGIRTRSLAGITPEDAWHHEQGYRHTRAAQALIYRKSGGVIGVHEVMPEVER